MNGLETAIRNALARAPTADAEQRERIYQSARTALEKSLHKQGADAETLESQRVRVEQVIATIEAEYSRAFPGEVETGSPSGNATRQGAGSDSRFGRASAPPVADNRIFADDAVPIRADDGTPPHVEPDEATRVEAVPPVDFTAEPVHRTDRDDGSSPVIEAGDRFDGTPDRPVPSAAALPERDKRSRRDRKRREKAARAAEKKPRRRGGSFRSFLIQLAVLVALIGAGLWWISANGGVEQVGRRLADSSAELLGGGADDSIFQPAQRVGAGQFSGDWVSVLSPEDFDTVEGGNGVILERVEDGDAEALRITSVGIGEAGEVRIPLGEEARAAMQDGRSVVALTVSTSGDETTQISVRCVFAGAENCARQRFEVFFERNDIIFDVNLAGGPTVDDAALLINSDISGEGRSIDLFAVRVQPTPR